MSTTELPEDVLELVDELSPRPLPLSPIPWPLLFRVSGLYTATRLRPPIFPVRPFEDGEAMDGMMAADQDAFPGPFPGPVPGPVPGPSIPRLPFPQPRIPHLPTPPIPTIPITEELRLDVDGHYPQMVASGVVKQWLTNRLHWIAELTKTGPNRWAGPITWKEGHLALLPQSHVEIQTTWSWTPSGRKATVTFSGGALPRTRVYGYSSAAFHEVELEFDRVATIDLVKSIETHAHPNRPSTLPAETLTIEKVFQRAGFRVRPSGGDSSIPVSGSGSDARWSDQEMHDAMVVHWSRFANAPQWSLWTLFADQHERGSSLGGIMFDDIGPNHRQGTALFLDSFISDVPTGESHPDAYRQRLRFWTAVHEMGHAFNLAHAWQKHLGNPWRPLASDAEARSFMNYPFRVSGGQAAFFSDFEFRFTDDELLFLRHAPEAYVQQGNADWFDDHGFEQTRGVGISELELVVRANREQDARDGSYSYEFLEPVILELKLTNRTGAPVILDASQLATTDEMTIVVKPQNEPARTFRPFARYCLEPRPIVLQPGESLYEPLFVSAGVSGWGITEPGRYLVQIALHLDERDVISAPMLVRVTPPRSHEEELLAQDVFTEDVGRVLAFEGSRELTDATAVLGEAAERLSDRRIALHARYVLGAPVARATKRLEIRDHGAEARFVTAKAEPKAAEQDMAAALTDDLAAAAETFGHITLKRRVDFLSEVLADDGRAGEAAAVQSDLLGTMRDRGVLDRVLGEIHERIDRLEEATEAAATKRRSKAKGKGSKKE